MSGLCLLGDFPVKGTLHSDAESSLLCLSVCSTLVWGVFFFFSDAVEWPSALSSSPKSWAYLLSLPVISGVFYRELVIEATF